MKRVKSYNQFRDSRDSKVNEEFINKLWRKITGADEKEIVELSAKIKSEYDSYSESEKRILSNEIDNYIRKKDITSKGAFANSFSVTSEITKVIFFATAISKSCIVIFLNSSSKAPPITEVSKYILCFMLQ